jgi:beta-lactam-binding protein with PASTA domain
MMPRSRLIPRGRFGWIVVAVILVAILIHAHKPHVLLPQLKGMTAVSAVARLSHLGLVGVYLHSASIGCVPVVVRSNPPAGDAVARGSTINLLVSCPVAER